MKITAENINMETAIGNYHDALSQIIRRKAVGPNGSRNLERKDLDIIIPALQSDEVSMTTKAVFIASVIIQQKNQLEKDLLEAWRHWRYTVPDTLSNFFFTDPDTRFSTILHKVLQRKDLSVKEASSAISYLLDDDIPNYQKGVLLIGQRLKRETFMENKTFLQSFRKAIDIQEVDVPLLVDLADPYDGFRRYPIYTPFIAATLASIGFPTYCHGLSEVAPKYGDTIHKVLKLAGKDPYKDSTSVAKDIENRSIGWGYVDQSVYFPNMHKQLGLRDKIIKRTFLATLEKLLHPLRASEGTNYMVAGYVHSHYRQELANLLELQKSLDKVLVVKGMEGSTQIDFRKDSKPVLVQLGNHMDQEVRAFPIEYSQDEWDQQPSLAEYVLETGTAALKGEHNAARAILTHQVSQLISGFEPIALDDARNKVVNVIESGRALQHWDNGSK
ncbi:hypothetical protein [Fodinibius saliphilus]|uniref:hypothetical protein n=1 Tax=Fodinibius saliphilus TaxID=1920650 RepID=UPI001107F8B3|nr:hypothetical protein [Fodinibius saliphilus]